MSDYDPTDLRGLEHKKAEREARSRVQEKSEAEDFKWLMSSKRGRRIVWRQLERAGVYRSSFNTNSMAMAFAEGNKNEGLRTVALIHTHCHELYSVMVRENVKEEPNE